MNTWPIGLQKGDAYGVADGFREGPGRNAHRRKPRQHDPQEDRQRRRLRRDPAGPGGAGGHQGVQRLRPRLAPLVHPERHAHRRPTVSPGSGRPSMLPGDIVIAKREGVVFVPAHLAEGLIEDAEVSLLRDMFTKERLADGTYTSGQLDQGLGRGRAEDQGRLPRLAEGKQGQAAGPGRPGPGNHRRLRLSAPRLNTGLQAHAQPPRLDTSGRHPPRADRAPPNHSPPPRHRPPARAAAP
ncbi:hypothetical protein LV779_24785 [Streptomyces thinghirensis]|nr:hypothetical protein [Streptomyces thinghirensis]